eukprot:TRINITY_DN18984_c0_g1_i1.p1 TRINITY_DN18984_c0_g1~~TRINITY_DN18984_c0_g1_i1.p1  ORF type:complete len:427 (-),score=124.90 TRINITY_DN18984_c0_g1_i1:363-1643(-)
MLRSLVGSEMCIRDRVNQASVKAEAKVVSLSRQIVSRHGVAVPAAELSAALATLRLTSVCNYLALLKIAKKHDKAHAPPIGHSLLPKILKMPFMTLARAQPAVRAVKAHTPWRIQCTINSQFGEVCRHCRLAPISPLSLPCGHISCLECYMGLRTQALHGNASDKSNCCLASSGGIHVLAMLIDDVLGQNPDDDPSKYLDPIKACSPEVVFAESFMEFEDLFDANTVLPASKERSLPAPYTAPTDRISVPSLDPPAEHSRPIAIPSRQFVPPKQSSSPRRSPTVVVDTSNYMGVALRRRMRSGSESLGEDSDDPGGCDDRITLTRAWAELCDMHAVRVVLTFEVGEHQKRSISFVVDPAGGDTPEQVTEDMLSSVSFLTGAGEEVRAQIAQEIGQWCQVAQIQLATNRASERDLEEQARCASCAIL